MKSEYDLIQNQTIMQQAVKYGLDLQQHKRYFTYIKDIKEISHTVYEKYSIKSVLIVQ